MSKSVPKTWPDDSSSTRWGEEILVSRRSHVTREGYWGLQWVQIDVDSLMHLRRLLELNLNDPGLLTRELAELG